MLQRPVLGIWMIKLSVLLIILPAGCAQKQNQITVHQLIPYKVSNYSVTSFCTLETIGSKTEKALLEIISNELEQRGYQRASTPKRADFSVSVESRTEFIENITQPSWGSRSVMNPQGVMVPTSVYKPAKYERYYKATITIQFKLRQSKDVIWSVLTETRLDKNEIEPRAVEIIAKAIEIFPGKPRQ